ncbi:cytidylyltransferase domain-containing protein [Reichenbachiella sp.]
MSKIIAFIPARGGSKSIPLKNIKLLCGQPLILWSIQELLKTESIDEIWVATDSREIKKVVSYIKSNRLFVYDREVSNAQDTSSTEDVMLEFIEKKKLNDEVFILVQATSPFTIEKDFSNALKTYASNNYDSLLSGVRYKRFFWDLNGAPINYDFNSRPRRQDFNGVFLENGAFYISTVQNIVESKNRLSGRIGQYEMEEYTAIEIDEELDWVFAERIINEKGQKPELVKKRCQIKLFASDVDGVLTDAGMYYSEQGDELKKFNTRDGKGFELLRNAGIKTAIITSENTQIVSNRANKLNVDYLYQGKTHGDKLDAIKEICSKESILLSEVAYIGDDINCKEALENVGMAACPIDAVEEIKQVNNIIQLDRKGGQGVVRRFAEQILNQMNHES